MGRPRKQSFITESLAELTRQLQYSPRSKRVEQVRRAEALHDELDRDSAYPLEYLAYRITRYHPQSESDALLPGDVAAADLRLLIDRLSRSAAEPAEEDDPVHRLADVADRAGVSLRTVDRWRHHGLRWRWWLPGSTAEPVVGIPETAWQHFQRLAPRRVARATGFTRLAPDDRRRALDRARELTGDDDRATLGRVARQLADELQRSPEAMRQLLLDHDRNHPDTPLFPLRTGPLTPRQRDLAERAYRRGVPLRRIADRLRRTVPTVHHVVQQRRLHRLEVTPLEYVMLPGFDDPRRLDEVLASPLLRPDAKRSPALDTTSSDTSRTPPRLDDLPPAVASVLDQPVPPWPLQRALVARMHAHRARADRLRREANRSTPRAGDLDRAEADLAEADRIEARLIALNAATALSVVRRHLQARGLGGSGAVLRYTSLALDVVRQTIVSFDASTRRTLDAVIRNRLLQRFAHEPQSTGRAEQRPRPAAWSRKLLEAYGVACAVPVEGDAATPRPSSATAAAPSAEPSAASPRETHA